MAVDGGFCACCDCVDDLVGERLRRLVALQREANNLDSETVQRLSQGLDHVALESVSARGDENRRGDREEGGEEQRENKESSKTALNSGGSDLNPSVEFFCPTTVADWSELV